MTSYGCVFPQRVPFRRALVTLLILGLALTRLAEASPPTAPGSLTATSVSSTQVALSWAASTDDTSITAYVIQRCQGSGCTTFAQVASQPTGTAFIDSNLAPGATYQYEIYATDSLAASSSASNVATATTFVPSVASSVNYAYDALGRLVQATVPGLNLVENYAYDAGGNLLSVTSSPVSVLAVSSVSNTQATPGNTITLYGSGFSTDPSADIVKIGGVVATVISATSTQLVVTVPAGATSGPITVTTGVSSVTGSTSFTVTAAPAAPTITSAPALAAPGSNLVISGTGFQTTPTGNTVFIGGQPVPVISATSTALTLSAPLLNNSAGFAAAAGRITVTTPFGTATSATPLLISAVNFGAVGTLVVDGPPTTVTTSQSFNAIVFDGTAGQNLAMSFTAQQGFSAGVFAPDGSTLLGSNAFSNNGGMRIPTLPTTGTYVMEITGAGAQTLSASIKSPVTGTLTLNGSPVTITTTSPGQSASLTFSGTQGAYVAVNLSNVTLSSGTVEILNPDSSVLSSLPFGTSGATLSPQLPTTGTYTVLVLPSATGSGSLTASVNSSSPTLAANQGAYNSAVTSGTPLTIPFDGTAGQYLSLAGNPSGSLSSATVTVQQPDGSQLTQVNWSWCNPGCGSPVLNMGPLKQSGTYSVTISPNGTGNLALYLTTPLAIGALSPSTNVTTPITQLGQAVVASFRDTYGDYPAVMTIGVMGTITTVLAQDGTVVASANSTDGQWPLNLGPLQENNTYTVLVQQTQTIPRETISIEWLPAATPALPVGPNPPPVNLLGGQAMAGTFSATAGQYAQLTISEPTIIPMGSKIAAGGFYVLSPNGLPIASGALSTTSYCASGGSGNEGCGGFGYAGSSTVVFGPLPQTGTYTVVFQVAGGGAGAGVLVPTITVGPPSTTTIGTTTTQTSAGTTFAGTAGQYISIDLSSSSQINISLLDPTGAVLVGPVPSSNILNFGPLPSSGTYTIVAQTSAQSVALTVATPVTGTLTPGTPSTASINLPGQGANYTFTATAGQYYTASASETSGGIWSATVSVVSSSGATIASTTMSSTCRSTCTGTATLNVGPLPANDTYSLLVQPTNLNAAGASSLTLQVTNNTSGSGTTQSLSTSTPGASAQFTFQGAANESFHFTLTNMVLTPSSVSQYTYQITAPNGAVFQSSLCAGSSCDDGMPALPQTGVYTVTVTPDGAATMTGTATVSTPLQAGPIVVDTPLNLSLLSGQTAIIPFTAGAGQSLLLSINGLTMIPSGGAYNIYVDNAAGQTIGYATTQQGTLIDLPNLAAGNYTIALAPAGTTSGSMQVALTQGVAGALPLTGNGVNVSTSTPGNYGYFTFPAVTGQGYSLAVSGLSMSPSGAYASVKTPTFTFGGGGTNCSPPGCVAHMAYAFLSQDYTITVVPNGLATMSFVATLSQDVIGTLAPNVPSNISLGETGQSAELTFDITSVSSPTLLLNNFTPTPSTATYHVIIYSLDQSYAIVTNFDLSGSSPSAAFNLPTLQPGTYLAVIVPNAPAVARLQLTFDPNSSAILPVAGSSATVTTSAPGENAYLSFNGTAGQPLTLALTNLVLTPGSSSNLSLVVTNPNGTWLLNATCSPTAQGCELTLPLLPQTGTYTVTVAPPSSSAMSFKATVPPVVTGALTAGTPVTVQWSTPGQAASFNFTLPTQQTVAVNFGSITTTPANTSVNMTLYDSNGNQVGQPVSSATNGTLNFANLAAGTYKVLITPAAPATGSLQVTLAQGAGGSLQTNGSSATFTTAVPGQNAYVTFSANSGDSLTAALTNLVLSPASPNYISWTITAPDGSTVANAANCYTSTTPGCFAGMLIAPLTGTYSINIVPQGPQTASFTLNVAKNFTATLTPPATQTLNFSAQLGQGARFAFTVSPGQSLAASLTGITTTPANTKIWMGVYTPSGSYVMGADTTTGEVLNLSGLAPGNYLLWISYETLAASSMQFSFFAGLNNALPTDGSSNNVSTSAPGENAHLSFSANAGDSLTAVLTNLVLSPGSPNYLSLSITAPDGSTVTGPNNCTAPGCFVPEIMTAPLTGTYSINIVPQGPQTASFTLNIAKNLTGTLTPPATQAINFSNQLGQAARFAFTMSSGQSLSATLSGITTTPANTQVWMGVYTPSGGYVTGGTTYTGETLNLSSLSPGNYILWIGNINPATSGMQLSFQ